MTPIAFNQGCVTALRQVGGCCWMSHCLVPTGDTFTGVLGGGHSFQTIYQMTYEGLYSLLVPLGAPGQCDVDCIHCAYILRVQLNLFCHPSYTVHLQGNMFVNCAWSRQGRGKALAPMPSRGFLAVSLERVQHTHTSVIKTGGKGTCIDACSV